MIKMEMVKCIRDVKTKNFNFIKDKLYMSTRRNTDQIKIYNPEKLQWVEIQYYGYLGISTMIKFRQYFEMLKDSDIYAKNKKDFDIKLKEFLDSEKEYNIDEVIEIINSNTDENKLIVFTDRLSTRILNNAYGAVVYDIRGYTCPYDNEFVDKEFLSSRKWFRIKFNK